MKISKFLILLSVCLILMIFNAQKMFGQEEETRKTQQELTVEEIFDKITIEYRFQQYCQRKQYPIVFYNYINALEIKRINSNYSIYITQEDIDLYCIQILNYNEKEKIYNIIDEKYFLYNQITDLFLKKMISSFVLYSNPCRVLE